MEVGVLSLNDKEWRCNISNTNRHHLIIKFISYLNHCQIFSFTTKLFVKPTKEFFIVFCLKKPFVRSKILLGQRKKFVSSILIFLRACECDSKQPIVFIF